MIGVLFFIFGFVTWLNGILIPFLKQSCELSDFQSYLVATAFFAAYFVMALPSSLVLKALGTKKGISAGLIVMAVGSLIFIPAANARDFDLFLFGLFVQGTGLALLQTAANPYVSVLGPIESAAQRISIMGICNKFAGIMGNLIFGSLLLINADAITKKLADVSISTEDKKQLLNDLATRVNLPYTGLAIFLVAMAIYFYFSKLPDISENTEVEDTKATLNKTSIFQFPHVWFGFLGIFCCVAVEVMAGDLITTYGKNLGFQTADTKFFTIFGLVGLLIGYISGIILIPKYIKQEVWLSICALMGISLTLISVYVDQKSAVFCLAALGFVNASIWPAIFPLGIKDLGRFTNTGSAILIMGIVGGAVVPPFYGWLYEKSGIAFLNFRNTFALIMVICYAYIYFFGKRGHRVVA